MIRPSLVTTRVESVASGGGARHGGAKNLLANDCVGAHVEVSCCRCFLHGGGKSLLADDCVGAHVKVASCRCTFHAAIGLQTRPQGAAERTLHPSEPLALETGHPPFAAYYDVPFGKDVMLTGV